MQVCRRRRASNAIDHELLWLVVSLGAVALLGFWLSLGLPTPHCAFRSLTGLPCPTCGATRAAWQFLHGHFLASFLFNPLAFLAYCIVVAFDLYAFAVLILRAPRLRFTGLTSAERAAVRYSVLALLAANWLYLLTFQR
ncbi:MAG TPA: DUF2752 domain-containing protein [Chthoniobacterales bacterium]|jgi:hypothetical protein